MLKHVAPIPAIAEAITNTPDALLSMIKMDHETTCERRPMSTFWRAWFCNESSDDESDTDSESHFANFEQDRLEARLAVACAA